MKVPAASPPRTSSGFPWIQPCEAAGAPLSTRQKMDLFADQTRLDWPETIRRLEAMQGGAMVLQKLLVTWIELERLLRWVFLAARLEEIAVDRRPQSEALKLAERWLREKDDKLRYEAYRQADDEAFSTPGAMAAMTAFVCGPSIAPRGAGVAAPAAHLPRSAALGVLISIAVAEPLKASGVERVNLIGLELAQGGDGRKAARAALAGGLA